MNYKILIILLFIVSLSGYAQEEMGAKSKAFPAENKKEKPKKVVPPSPKAPPVEAPEIIKPLKPINDRNI